MSKYVNFLEEMLEILNRGWCQGFAATDAWDLPVPVVSPEACQWCLGGAYCLVESQCRYETEDRIRVRGILKKAISKRGYRSIVAFNDAKERTKENVLALVREAIDEAKKNL